MTSYSTGIQMPEFKIMILVGNLFFVKDRSTGCLSTLDRRKSVQRCLKNRLTVTISLVSQLPSSVPEALVHSDTVVLGDPSFSFFFRIWQLTLVSANFSFFPPPTLLVLRSRSRSRFSLLTCLRLVCSLFPLLFVLSPVSAPSVILSRSVLLCVFVFYQFRYKFTLLSITNG